MCEPQLGERNLYHSMGGPADSKANELAMLWVLNLSDGKHSLLEISQRSRLRFDAIARAASSLKEHGLLEEVPAQSQFA
jgi:aminopeptidase-like protein